MSAKNFACSLANAKKSFYRAFNAVFGKVSDAASEEVTEELVKVTCLLMLLYSPISNEQYRSLDTALNGCFRNISHTRMVVQECFKGDEVSQ